MLHWANKDQYYTKSGESFSNYAFTLENGKKVQFRLVDADTAKDNRKDNEQARVFALIEPKIKTETDENGDEIQTDIRPIEENGDLLTIRFEYKAVNKKEKQSDYITQAVERIQNFAIPDEFQGIFKAMPTEKSKNRTLLEKYLTDYTAKNTADYFIHKNLGKFLNQELDFYIKNEVMNLDNIQDSTDFSHIEQNLQTIKTIKTVAKEIIAFLAQLEDFQKKLWLKKKFVAGCHYLITLDHLNEAQVQVALDNPKQTAQWQVLFNVNASGLNAAELYKNYPHLVVDTALFEPKFQADLLGKIEHLDDNTNGLLIHSDNFQALNLLQERYKEQVKCIYIDPPYNTGGDGFIYKDGYQKSSWASLIHNRLTLAKPLLNQAGVIFQSIDDNEQVRLKLISDEIFGTENFISLLTVENNPKGRKNSKFISVCNDYCLIYSADNKKSYFIENIPKDIKDLAKDEYGNYVHNSGKRVLVGENKFNNLVQKMDSDKHYTIYYNKNSYDLILKKETSLDEVDENLISQGYVRYISYLDNNFVENTYTDKKIKELFDNKALEFKDNKIYEKNFSTTIRLKSILSNRKYKGVIQNKEEIVELDFKTTSAGTLLKNLFSKEDVFPAPKNIKFIQTLATLIDDKTQIILDYFAGSGTTAHAVINLNREDNGSRKYILVEQGEYFDSVLKPRVQKVIFAKEWKDGKPQTDNGAFGGVSQIVKVLKLESYEDTLNNLELKQPASDLFAPNEELQNDYLLHYMLDVESRDSLLNTQHFTKPFDYQLNIATTSAGAYEAKTIDLVETFNYLIGLRVCAIDDQREKYGWVTVKGKLANGDNTLIIWRDCEKVGYGELNDFIRKNAYGVEDKAEYSEETFKVVYINGDHNVPTVFTDSDDSVKALKVRSIEAEFLSRIFG